MAYRRTHLRDARLWSHEARMVRPPKHAAVSAHSTRTRMPSDTCTRREKGLHNQDVQYQTRTYPLRTPARSQSRRRSRRCVRGSAAFSECPPFSCFLLGLVRISVNTQSASFRKRVKNAQEFFTRGKKDPKISDPFLRFLKKLLHRGSEMAAAEPTRLKSRHAPPPPAF